MNEVKVYVKYAYLPPALLSESLELLQDPRSQYHGCGCDLPTLSAPPRHKIKRRVVYIRTAVAGRGDAADCEEKQNNLDYWA